METLVVVAQHRNQNCSRSRSRISDRFASSPSKGFKGINCRTFQSGVSIFSSSPPSFSEPKSPHCYSEPPKNGRRSKPIAINTSASHNRANFDEELICSELWAGPAYSNSPPPSSLPIPKFSLRQKRSVSLDLPVPKPEVVIRPLAKSAPSSPTREFADDFFLSTATATENLRRILNLDVADD